MSTREQNLKIEVSLAEVQLVLAALAKGANAVMDEDLMAAVELEDLIVRLEKARAVQQAREH